MLLFNPKGASDSIEKLQDLLRSVTTPPLASTNVWGSIPNTSFHVPAAAHTSGHYNKPGSMSTRNCLVYPERGAPPLALETQDNVVTEITHVTGEFGTRS